MCGDKKKGISVYRESRLWCTALDTEERASCLFIVFLFINAVDDSRAQQLPSYNARLEPPLPSNNNEATGVAEKLHVFFLFSKHQLHLMYPKQWFSLQTLKALRCSLNDCISKLNMQSR